jgi:hypothetical protein
MSLLNTQTRMRYWPLKGDQGEAPAWEANGQVNFNMSNIPKTTKGMGGNLANYVPAIALTVWGTYSTDGDQDADTRVLWNDFTQALYGSFDLQGAWHGRPLAAQQVRGATARFWETISMGYQSGSRHSVGLRASSATLPFRHTLYLPLCHALGKNGARYTSQLSVCYKDATLILNLGTDGTLIDRPGSETEFTLTIESAQIRASAVLLPERSLRIAPGVEWLEYQTKGASAGSDPVDLDSLGNATALEGVEPGAGIDTMLALCNLDGLNGSFNLASLSMFSFPALDQSQTKHLDPFMNALEQASSKGQLPRSNAVETIAGAAPALAGLVIDSSGLPYDDFAFGPNQNGNDGSTLGNNGLCFPIIVAGPDLEATKLQRFEGTQTYFRTISAAAGTIDRTLIHQFKSWTPAKHEDFRQLIISSGLANDVLGTNVLEPKAARNEAGGPVEYGKARFFPVEWVPASNPEKKAA